MAQTLIIDFYIEIKKFKIRKVNYRHTQRIERTSAYFIFYTNILLKMVLTSNGSIFISNFIDVMFFVLGMNDINKK